MLFHKSLLHATGINCVIRFLGINMSRTTRLNTIKAIYLFNTLNYTKCRIGRHEKHPSINRDLPAIFMDMLSCDNHKRDHTKPENGSGQCGRSHREGL